MGKKKFDKSNSVTFKLIYKSSDDTENADKTLSERIFSVIEADKKKAIQENDKNRQRILSQFTNEELGKTAPKSAKNNIQKDTVNHTDNISSHAKGRNDLWITHLMRMKNQAKAEVDMEEEEKEEQLKREKVMALLKKKQAIQKKAKKDAKKEEKEEKEEEGDEDEDGDEEGWESCEEDEGEEEEEEDEQVEIEEWEEEEEEQEEEPQEDDNKEIVYKKVIEGKGRGDDIVQAAEPVIQEDDFPALGLAGEGEHGKVVIPEAAKPKEKTKEEEIAEEEINLKKIKVKGDVKLKRYDDMGLPLDGYNYYQHIVDSHVGGAPSFAFTTTYDQLQILPEDSDLKKEKMNAEEKELYEALEYVENPGYEAIEDNFFEMLTKENPIIVEEDDGTTIQPTKKVAFKDDEIKEILMTKEAPAGNDSKKGKDSIMKRTDFQKVLNQHVELLKDKYKEERAKNRARFGIESSDEEEEEEVEEVESWDEDDENNRPKEYVEKLPFKDDIAMQKVMDESEKEEDSEDEQYDRALTKNSKVPTEATSAHVPSVVMTRTPKLHIIKEERPEKKQEGSEAPKQSEAGDEEEEEEDGNKVEEVFRKRDRNETAEEKKERKALIKQFKQERKEKKKNFKETFETRKKEHIKTTERQLSKLQGYSIFKLST